MVTLVIASQKGGVGKTTVSINLAYSLARRGWHTLLADADPQGSVGLSLSRKAREHSGFYDLLAHRTGLGGAILHTRLPELKLLPSGVEHVPSHAASSSSKSVDGGYERPPMTAEALFHELSAQNFDVVIIDTPAGVHGITTQLLRAADFVMIPQQAEPLALRSVPHLLRTLTEIRAEHGRPEVTGVLLTMLDRHEDASLEVLAEVRALFPRSLLFDTHIPRDPDFLKASRIGVPLSLLYRKPPAAALLFDQLAAELESRMNLITPDPQADSEYTRLMD